MMDIDIVDDPRDQAECFKLRRRVFVEEQGVSEHEESDGKDDTCTHVLVRENGEPIGAARFLYIGDCVKIQRVCVAPEFRGLGIGAKIIEFIVAHARHEDLARVVRLGAQVHAISFYDRLGFQVIGPEYLDAGILHRDMELRLT